MVTSNYFWSMIICTLIIFIFGNISNIMRNLFILIMYAYSLTTLLTTFTGSYSLITDGISLFALNFSFSWHGFMFSAMNHAVFPILYLDIITDDGRKHPNSTSTLMFLLFFAMNMLFFSSDIFTFISMSAVTGLISLFLIILNTRRSGINSFMYVELFADLLFAAAASLFRNSLATGTAGVIFYGALILKSGALYGSRPFLRLMGECDPRLASYFMLSVLKGALFAAVVFRPAFRTPGFTAAAFTYSVILILISFANISKAYLAKDFRNSFTLALLGSSTLQTAFAVNPFFKPNIFFTAAVSALSVFFAVLMFESSVVEREVKSTLMKFTGGLGKRMRRDSNLSLISAFGASGIFPLSVALPAVLALRGVPDNLKVPVYLLTLILSLYVSGVLLKSVNEIFSGEIKQYNLNVESIRSRKDAVLYLAAFLSISIAAASPAAIWLVMKYILKTELQSSETVMLFASLLPAAVAVSLMAADRKMKKTLMNSILSGSARIAKMTMLNSGRMPDYAYTILSRRFTISSSAKLYAARAFSAGYALPAAAAVILLIIISLLTEGW